MNEIVERELGWLEEHVLRVGHQAGILSLELGDRGVLLKHVFEALHGLVHEVMALREELKEKKEEVEETRKEEHEPLSPELEEDLKSGDREGGEPLPEMSSEPPSCALADNAPCGREPGE